jgi:uncharacterized SAM-binding protein YcdF (DUF218 family)
MDSFLIFAKKSIETLISPLGIMTVLLFSGIVLSFAKRFRSLGHRLLIVGALMFLFFLFSPLSQYLTYSLEHRFRPLLTPPRSPSINKIVVLAGYAENHPKYPITSNVSWQTLGNLSEGLRLYRLVPGSKLILSGGVAREGDKSVAALMADCLQQMGVPASDLIVEGASQNTYENLREVKKRVGTHPFILVATACDLRRAVAVAKKLGMNSIPAPARIWTLQNYPTRNGLSDQFAYFFGSLGSPSLDNLSRLQWAYHEYLGYAWYRLLGRI